MWYQGMMTVRLLTLGWTSSRPLSYKELPQSIVWRENGSYRSGPSRSRGCHLCGTGTFPSVLGDVLMAASRWSSSRRGKLLCLVHGRVGSLPARDSIVIAVHWGKKKKDSCHMTGIQYWPSRTEWGESFQWTEKQPVHLVLCFVWEKRPEIWIHIHIWIHIQTWIQVSGRGKWLD